MPYGTTPDFGPDPEKADGAPYTYAFTGWDSAVSNVVGEAVYTATYVKLNPEAPVISPESGTLIDTSLSVTMSCPTEGATIHYTTNGVEPTAESPVYKRFRIYGKTTIKAVAEKDGYLSDVVVAEYAFGRCSDPVISLADGAVFEHSNQEVSIAWNGSDGVLRYTLDGSDPTGESPVYTGALAISESTVVKAKVFSDTLFDSAVVTASLMRVWVRVATPVIDAPTAFTGSGAMVAINCATEGATVRYTLNGNDPDSCSVIYTEPFYVTGSCTVKTYATLADYADSVVATLAIEKVWGIGDTLGMPDQTFSTSVSGGLGWVRVVDVTAPNGEAMRSGAITHNQSSVLSTVVTGSGVLSFTWRTSCEEDPLHEWDHLECAVDGIVVGLLDGETAWRNESVEIAGVGMHTVEWRYVKDDAESEGEDCAWLGSVSWTPEVPATQWAISYENLKGAENPNPLKYQEGRALVFLDLPNVSGYTFAGWTPSSIPADATGDKVVTANWNWTPEDAVVDAAVTGGNALNVNAEWVKTELDQRFGEGRKQAFISKFGDDFAAALTKKTGKTDGAGNELAVWHDYVAGTDPTDINSTLKATIEIKDGVPVIGWEPNLNKSGEVRTYTIYGAANLGDGNWHTPTNALDRFFKVDVRMP